MEARAACVICSTAIDAPTSETFGGLCESCARKRVQEGRGYLPKYATFFRRICAHFVDALLVSFVLALADPISRMALNTHLVFSVEVLILVFLMLYPALMHTFLGQTIGKMVVRIKVLTLDEAGCISFPRALIREIAPIVMLPVSIYVLYYNVYFPSEGISDQSLLLKEIIELVILSWYILEVGSMLLNSKRRALHDYLAGSVVVKLDSQN